MIDVIVCQPKDVLYPWWMQMIKKNRDLFGEVIVIMTQAATAIDFTAYIQGSLPRITLIEHYHDDGRDWRNAAIHEALKKSSANTILFLEQDFLFEDAFLKKVLTLAPDFPVIGFHEGSRLHPAFLLVKRDVLEKTRQDFSVDPDKGDHFSKLTTDLEDISVIYELSSADGNWIHLAGTTQNYRLTNSWYSPIIFHEYNHLSQTLEQHPYWKEFCRQKEIEMGSVPKLMPPTLERYFSCVLT